MKKYLVTIETDSANKIPCIKWLREAFSLGLKEAKDLHDACAAGPLVMTGDELAEFHMSVELPDRNCAQAQLPYTYENYNITGNEKPLFVITRIEVFDQQIPKIYGDLRRGRYSF